MILKTSSQSFFKPFMADKSFDKGSLRNNSSQQGRLALMKLSSSRVAFSALLCVSEINVVLSTVKTTFQGEMEEMHFHKK